MPNNISKNTSKSNDQLSIFISHRTKDKNLADVLCEHFEKWTRREVHITQSSDPNHGFEIGKPLTEELRSALKNSDVLLFLYTVPDEDWSYCMFECGFASTQPKRRLVIFQFGGTAPAPLENLVRVEYSLDGIRAFTDQFFRNDTFFYSRNKALAEKMSGEAIEEKAIELYKALEKENPTITKRPITRWLFIKLILVLDHKVLKEIRGAENDDVAIEMASTIFNSSCHVTMDSDKYAIHHFGISELRPDITLNQLYNTWKQDLIDFNKKSGSSFEVTDWLSELKREMVRVIRNRPALEVSNYLKSVKADEETWYLPIINRAEATSDDLQWEFQVELYRIRREYTDQSKLRAVSTSETGKMTFEQAQKLNDLAIDRDLYKLYHRVCQKIDDKKEEGLISFIQETIVDTYDTWRAFQTPFKDSRFHYLSDLYEMYSGKINELEKLVENIIDSENPPEEKKKVVFSLLYKNVISMKTHFRNCVQNEDQKTSLNRFQLISKAKV